MQRHLLPQLPAAGNVPPSIAAKIGQNLHLRPLHPLNILKTGISAYFQRQPQPFRVFDDLHPRVTVKQCFDDLLIPADHVSRSPSDTFYTDPEHVLRTHTSAHQTQFLRQGLSEFLVFGDCYRRDEIDKSHYPIFHQVEGVQTWPKAAKSTKEVQDHLKHSLEGLAQHLLKGRVSDFRWVDAYFPFTNPSLELEVMFKGDWLELLGCGVIESKIMEDSGRGDEIGWAFGIGLERLAMTLFNIPDIRLFWSEDPRFLSQFTSYDEYTQFQSFSKYPPCYKDVAFWLPEDGKFEPNDFFAEIREVAGDLVESVELIDGFTHPKTKRESKCYRINYRSMERSLTNAEVDELQEQVLQNLRSKLRITTR